MDDGLQSKDIKKDFKILVLDDQYGFGNKFVLPAGPLRQTIKNALKNCDVILIIKNNKISKNLKIEKHKNIFYAEKRVKLKKLKYKNIFVFSGLGNNENFVSKLQKLNVNIKMIKNFPDHHKFSNNEVSNIIKTAKEKNYLLCALKKIM